jgi:hypothetical protein
MWLLLVAPQAPAAANYAEEGGRCNLQALLGKLPGFHWKKIFHETAIL